MSKKELDYLNILKALEEIPFGVGKKLLIEFLQGKDTNESVLKHKLYVKDSFGSLAYEKDELDELIERLIMNNMIQITPLAKNRFVKILELSSRGAKELKEPLLHKRKISFDLKTKTEITAKDKELFSAFSDFLEKYNEPQKKAITSNAANILCIAGAGSGKTTVLTKRIEFLINYRSVDPENILAITFTRKARQEMRSRLKNANIDLVKVETFNSFCEKILRRYNNYIYEKQVKVINYKDKISILNHALRQLNLNLNRAVNLYFSAAQKRGKKQEQLEAIFLNDCFFVRDYFKFKGCKIEGDCFDLIDAESERIAKIIFSISNYIEAYMKKRGLRDFADQLIDALLLFKKHPEFIPNFEHILVDEYQDVNATQIELTDVLAPANFFCVGDPRQAIYGWRGSDIKYILNFEEKYSNCEVIILTKNYRSHKHIVNLINNAIKNMRLADLDAVLNGEKDAHLLKFDSESAEFEFVIQKVIASDIPRNDIFVLARTNRQLNELSNALRLRQINHIVRSDELKRSVQASKNDITLATIHAIKGLEAKMVFVIGCTGLNFPCRGSEHPVIDMIKVENYDKEEEERRLFYVAMSRARESLFLTYAGKKHTFFVSKEMQELLTKKELKIEPKVTYKVASNKDTFTRLKEWRLEISRQQGIPAYMIMHDTTLLDLVQRSPTTKEELQEVRGFGPTKISKYGEDILRIITC